MTSHVLGLLSFSCDAFHSNPTCAHPVFDVRAETPRVPIVTIDSASGTPTNFASHIIETEPGMEFESVLSLATALKAETKTE